jgi:hypothetical protein
MTLCVLLTTLTRTIDRFAQGQGKGGGAPDTCSAGARPQDGWSTRVERGWGADGVEMAKR